MKIVNNEKKINRGETGEIGETRIWRTSSIEDTKNNGS